MTNPKVYYFLRQSSLFQDKSDLSQQSKDELRMKTQANPQMSPKIRINQLHEVRQVL